MDALIASTFCPFPSTLGQGGNSSKAEEKGGKNWYSQHIVLTQRLHAACLKQTSPQVSVNTFKAHGITEIDHLQLQIKGYKGEKHHIGASQDHSLQ
jgi:hypothetical protein